MNKQIGSSNEKPFVIIGFMGSGKTTIGKALAKEISLEFIDSDKEIEHIFNMPTKDIFSQFGEQKFRETEADVIKSLLTKKNYVISLGGGAFLNPTIREICTAYATVIFLEVGWDAWKDRLSDLVDTRPLLQGKSIEELKEFYQSRQEIYHTNDIKIVTDYKNIQDIVSEVCNKVKDTI